MERMRIVERLLIFIALLCFTISFLFSMLVVVENESYKVIEKILIEENSNLELKIQSLEVENKQMKQIIKEMVEQESEKSSKMLKILKNMHRKNISYSEIVYYAGKLFDIDGLLLVALINSESGFVENIKHKNSSVIGISGIHTKFWNVDLSTIENQIFAGAYVLKTFIDICDGNVLDALVLYKGKSALGKR